MSTGKPPAPQAISALLAEAEITDTEGAAPACTEDGGKVSILWPAGVRVEAYAKAEKVLRRAGFCVTRSFREGKFLLIVTAREDQ